MWLLNTKTIQLRQFQDPSDLRYAILSHVWQKDEQTFQDLQPSSVHDDSVRRLSEKIRKCCMTALRDGYEWLWIDTCCIDKTSSSELSEAINSMYAWYANAAICYAYLFDVDDTDEPSAVPSSFRSSRWFTRGWTLQELIAPPYVVFLSSTWCTIGTKHTLSDIIEEITNIPYDVLVHKRALEEVSVARRMSWASTRETKREEDRAYSLLGIFGVHVPTIYGEGHNAFRRLQEEILRRSSDQTIFAWGGSVVGDPLFDFTFPPRDRWPTATPPHYLLASSPSDFRDLAKITTLPHNQYTSLLGPQINLTAPPQFRMTSYGMRAKLPLLIDLSFADQAETLCYAILAIQDEEERVGVLMLRMQRDAFGQCHVGTYGDQIGIVNLSYVNAGNYWRVVFVPTRLIQPLAAACELKQVNLRSFEPLSIRRHTLSASLGTTSDTDRPRYAFFIPKHVLVRLENAGFHLKRPGPGALATDGLFLETAGTVDAPVSFEVAVLPFDDGTPWMVISASSTVTIILSVILTIGIRCCQPSCPLDRSLRLYGSPPSLFRGYHPCWINVDLLVVDQSVKAPEREPSRLSLPLQGAKIPECTYGHLVDSDSPTLVYGDDVYNVKLKLRRWEHCHRTRAAFPYILDIFMTGEGLPSGFPTCPKRMR